MSLATYFIIYLKIVTVGVALACVAGGISAGVLYCFSSLKSLAASPLASRGGSRQENTSGTRIPAATQASVAWAF